VSSEKVKLAALGVVQGFGARKLEIFVFRVKSIVTLHDEQRKYQSFLKAPPEGSVTA
jgi:hypothetical protein